MKTGERADGPGGGSGGEDQRPAEFSGRASTQTRLHRGDAAAGTHRQPFSAAGKAFAHTARLL